MTYSLVKSTISHFNAGLIGKVLKNVSLPSLGILAGNYLVQEREIYQQNVRGEIRPTSLHLELTTYCPRKCIDCYVDIKDRGDAEVIKPDLALKAVRKGKSMGIRVVNLIGGETLSRDTLPVIKLLLNEEPFISIYSCTNGRLISSMTTELDDVVRKYNFSPGLSIDGLKETNDRIRGNGSYQFIISSVEYLRSRKSLFGAVATIREDNKEEVLSEDFIHFVVDQGFSYLFYSLSGDLNEESVKDVAKTLESFKDLPLFIYINSLGHADDQDTLKRDRIVYVDKHGNVLNDRRDRKHINTIDNLETVVSDENWLKRFDGIWIPK